MLFVFMECRRRPRYVKSAAQIVDVVWENNAPETRIRGILTQVSRQQCHSEITQIANSLSHAHQPHSVSIATVVPAVVAIIEIDVPRVA